MDELPIAALPTASSLPRSVLAVTTVISSWLLMQVIHECGHALCAVLTGGTVRQMVLVPWELSRTDLIQNPKPLIVCWAGPIVGAFVPLAVWFVARQASSAFAFWLRFLAGFCLIANGAYIGVGAFTRDGDAADLIRDGSPVWTLWIFGAVTAPAGLAMWHGLGKKFGFGRNASNIKWKPAIISLMAMSTVITVEVIHAAF